VREAENGAGRQFFAGHERRQPGENDGRHFSAKLLIYDGTNQRLEIRLPELNPIRSNALDQCGEYGIGIFEVQNGFSHAE
jgi:hypothetical protein